MTEGLRSASAIMCYCLVVMGVAAISISNRRLVDEQGREIRFHGTNVVMKVPPYIPTIDEFDPDRSFSKEDMINCRKAGFNGIRLGMMYILS